MHGSSTRGSNTITDCEKRDRSSGGARKRNRYETKRNKCSNPLSTRRREKTQKKDINYVLGDIIGEVCDWELNNTDKDTKKSQAIIDEAITTFDELIEKVNKRDVEDKRAHFRAINKELEDRGKALIDKLNKL